MLVHTKKTCGRRSFQRVKQVMASYSWSDSKAILKISQAKGLRDPKCGCTFEPFGFIKRVGDEFERHSSLSNIKK